MCLTNPDLHELLKDNDLIKFFDETDGMFKVGLTLLSLYIESNVRTIGEIQNTQTSNCNEGAPATGSPEVRTGSDESDVELVE